MIRRTSAICLLLVEIINLIFMWLLPDWIFIFYFHFSFIVYIFITCKLSSIVKFMYHKKTTQKNTMCYWNILNLLERQNFSVGGKKSLLCNRFQTCYCSECYMMFWDDSPVCCCLTWCASRNLLNWNFDMQYYDKEKKLWLLLNVLQTGDSEGGFRHEVSRLLSSNSPCKNHHNAII